MYADMTDEELAVLMKQKIEDQNTLRRDFYNARRLLKEAQTEVEAIRDEFDARSREKQDEFSLHQHFRR